MNENDLYFRAFQEASKMNTRLMWVTPEIAAEWLLKNTRNRSLRPGGAAVYTEEIRESRWQVVHQGIAFDVDGVLIDGQHRLNGVVDSGIPVPLNVTFGVPKGAMDAVDRGMARSVADVLRLEHDVEHSKRVQTLVGLLAPATMGYRLKMTPGMAMKVYRQWAHEITWLHGYPHQGALWAAPVSAALVIAFRKHPDEMWDFMRGYSTGAELKAGSPEHYLRECLMNNDARLIKRSPERRLQWVLAVLLRAVRLELISERGVRVDDESGVTYFLETSKRIGGRKGNVA